MVEDDAGEHGDEGFGHVEALFDKMGDEAVDDDEAAHDGAEDIEIREGDGRHGGNACVIRSTAMTRDSR